MLAVVCWRRRWRTGPGPATWGALMFTTLAVIAIVNLLPPDAAPTEMEWVRRATIATLILFPFFLYRFATSFARAGRLPDAFALAATAGLVAWAFALPNLPEEGAERSDAFTVFVFALLVQWTALSLVAAVRLWRAGRGQPGVARRRMRLLALGATAMNVALVAAGLVPPDAGPGVGLTTQGLALGSSLLFFLGFEPPAGLRVAWRRREEAAFRAAVQQTVAATEIEAMTGHLLPSIAGIVGARRVDLLDEEGVVIASFETPDAAERKTARSQEIRLYLRTGTLVVIASPYTPFFGEEEVRLAEFLGTLMDLSLERARLSRLQDLILKTAGDGIYGIDREGKVIFINPSGEEMLGFSAAQLVGNEMHALTHHSRPDGTSYPREECPIYRALEDGRAHRTENEVFWRSDGSRFPVEYASSPIREGDVITGVVVTFSDISERKLGEAAAALAYEREREARLVVEKTNAEMESFVYTVSHDLNSPLVSISGYLDFFRSDYGSSLPEQASFFLERMSASAKYMQALIRDLLEFSRVGRTETEREAVDLRDLVDHLVDEVTAHHPRLQVSAEALPTVRMNALRARQLFANLLQNAGRYAGEEPRVWIRVVDEIDGSVCLSLADNGPGIPPEHRERAFEVFQRLQDRQSQDGTGIGLAICKRIVESSGGEIWVADSEVGADFRITLPLAPATLEREEQT